MQRARNKEHKRTKDIADIYELLWYSDTNLSELKSRLFSIYPGEEARRTIQSFTEEDFDKVSKTIGVTKEEISRVLSALK